MGLIKVSIFQKSLPEGLNLAILKKLASARSDFLILPEYFMADQHVKEPTALMEKSNAAIDWLTRINESYRGTIIGGSAVLQEDGAIYNASPIIHDGGVVDWYRKRSLTAEEKPLFNAGKEPGVYILGGQRFSVLICNDVTEPDYYRELADMDVRLIFAVMSSTYREESADEKQVRDEEYFLKPARDNNMTIIKCGSVGTLFGKQLQGRSLVATPSGLSWRVAPQEEQQEIFKTIMVHT